MILHPSAAGGRRVGDRSPTRARGLLSRAGHETRTRDFNLGNGARGDATKQASGLLARKGPRARLLTGGALPTRFKAFREVRGLRRGLSPSLHFAPEAPVMRSPRPLKHR